ncbi:hypothetical protein ONQ60_28110 [Salmonella enterica subsp. enterica serovar Virginia]|nr:hypothetical protein [Salmonella enterica subsp. enterica serovar Virginia]
MEAGAQIGTLQTDAARLLGLPAGVPVISSFSRFARLP